VYCRRRRILRLLAICCIDGGKRRLLTDGVASCGIPAVSFGGRPFSSHCLPGVFPRRPGHLPRQPGLLGGLCLASLQAVGFLFCFPDSYLPVAGGGVFAIALRDTVGRYRPQNRVPVIWRLCKDSLPAGPAGVEGVWSPWETTRQAMALLKGGATHCWNRAGSYAHQV